LKRKNEEINMIQEKYQQSFHRADKLEKDMKATIAEATYFKEQFTTEHKNHLERVQQFEKQLSASTEKLNKVLVELDSKQHSIETLQQQLRVRSDQAPSSAHYEVWEAKVVNLESHLRECRAHMDTALQKEEAAKNELALTARQLATERRAATEQIHQLTRELRCIGIQHLTLGEN